MYSVTILSFENWVDHGYIRQHFTSYEGDEKKVLTYKWPPKVSKLFTFIHSNKIDYIVYKL